MSSIVISGNTSGSVTLSAPTVAGSQVFTLPYGAATTTSGSANVTLTNTSNNVQRITMTAANKSVILPDATTMATGGQIFSIYNDGALPFFIKNNAGAIISICPPSAVIHLSLIDNSALAGVWANQNGTTTVGEFEPNIVDSTNTIESTSYAYNIADNQYALVEPLTSSTMLIVWMKSTTTGIYGVVATNSGGTLTYGTTVQIYNGASTNCNWFSGRMLTSTTGLICVSRASNNVAVPITISGTTITVGTASATFGNGSASGVANYVNGVQQILLDTSDSTVARVLYSTSTTAIVMNTITHNGSSAPTLGTASAGMTVVASYCLSTMIQLTSTTWQIWYYSATNVLSSRIATTSGTSAPTLGTAVTSSVGTTISPINLKAIAYSSTETAIWQGSNNSTGNYLISYTVSGTTVTVQTLSGYLTDLTYGALSYGRFLKINSTTYIVQTAYGSGFAKAIYIPSDNLYVGSIMQPFSSFLGGYSLGRAFSTLNNYGFIGYPPQINGFGINSASQFALASNFFSGSTSSGITVGTGGTNGVNKYPIASVFQLY